MTAKNRENYVSLFVRGQKDRLGINLNTKPFNIFRNKVVHDKKSQLRKYGDIDLVVAQADLVQQLFVESKPGCPDRHAV